MLEDLICSKCGCSGLHACTGKPIPPVTAEQKEQLKQTLEQIFNDKAKPKEQQPL